MTRPRNQQIALQATPYYHCVCRCVRRAFLCGKDRYTGQSFEHRKNWLVARLAYLSEVFSLDVCAYAVMSNHYHVVVRICPDKAKEWPAKEVAERWLKLFSGPASVRDWLNGATLGDDELERVLAYVAAWRARLQDLSWFMRCLNEAIARRANSEDGCTGRFWEGRFKSQALLDERAVLACMAYVDLNPVRAGLATCPETSDHTSAQQRTREASTIAPGFQRTCPGPILLPFEQLWEGSQGESRNGADLGHYMELLDWTGRAVTVDKRGLAPGDAPEILGRFGIAGDTWLRNMTTKKRRGLAALGALEKLRHYAAVTGRRWLIRLSDASALG